jgi:Protein of unknown function (DUF1573)
VINSGAVVLSAVHPGELAETSLSIRNTRPEPLIIERIEKTCPCIDVVGVPVRLAPNETKDLKVTFDPSHDPDFEGRLSVEVTGLLADGSIGFQTRVRVDVGIEDRYGQD